MTRNQSESDDSEGSDDDSSSEQGNKSSNVRAKSYHNIKNVIEGKRQRRESTKHAKDDMIGFKEKKKKRGRKAKKKKPLPIKKKALKKKKNLKKKKLKQLKRTPSEKKEREKKEKVVKEKSKVKVADDEDDEFMHPNPNMIHLTKLNKIFVLHSSEIRANKKDKKKLFQNTLLAKTAEEKRTSRSIIECDLRYFDFTYLINKFESFDVIMLAPPFKTISIQEVFELRVELLSKQGFLFFWTGNVPVATAYEIMSKWGYDVIDQIVWVKLDKNEGKMVMEDNPENYFLNSHEMCMVGVKKHPTSKGVEYQSKVSNNIIVSHQPQNQSCPDQIYDIIDLMMPGSKKIELFTQQKIIRGGWFGLEHKMEPETTCQTENKDQKDINNNDNQLEININKQKDKIKNNSIPIFNQIQCIKCEKRPIVGLYFGCETCKSEQNSSINICQDCFFNSPPQEFYNNSHNEFHKLEIIHEMPQQTYKQKLKCTNISCKQDLTYSLVHKCLTCFEMYLCEKCYANQEKIKLPFTLVNSHQYYHDFFMIK